MLSLHRQRLVLIEPFAVPKQVLSFRRKLLSQIIIRVALSIA